MNIYQIVFGIDSGQVHCCFHDDNNASAGIGPNGEYNCFTCGAKAHDELGFIKKYFEVGDARAKRIQNSLKMLAKYRYSKQPLSQDQIDYLHSIGITDKVINKYMFQSKTGGKLMYAHTFNGVPVGYTWFNNPSLKSYNLSARKYHYDRNNVSGMVTPYDVVLKNYKNIIITEGEKDMLTAQSLGIPNVVAKVGGAKAHLIGGVNFHNRSVVIIYDCDDAGREGAQADAQALTTRFGCKVRVVDLGLKHGEDLNDYFYVYNNTVDDLVKLIQNTPYYVPQTEVTLSKVARFVESLSADEYNDLINYIAEKNIEDIQNRKGE